jgi:aspartate/methionine/tyrosine aminotransferase
MHLTKPSLREYMKFCARNGLYLVSDEIYALSVWNNPRLPDTSNFTSVLSVDVKDIMDPSMVHVVWGLSKVRSPIPRHFPEGYLTRCLTRILAQPG